MPRFHCCLMFEKCFCHCNEFNTYTKKEKFKKKRREKKGVREKCPTLYWKSRKNGKLSLQFFNTRIVLGRSFIAWHSTCSTSKISVNCVEKDESIAIICYATENILLEILLFYLNGFTAHKSEHLRAVVMAKYGRLHTIFESIEVLEMRTFDAIYLNLSWSKNKRQKIDEREKRCIGTVWMVAYRSYSKFIVLWCLNTPYLLTFVQNAIKQTDIVKCADLQPSRQLQSFFFRAVSPLFFQFPFSGMCVWVCV